MSSSLISVLTGLVDRQTLSGIGSHFGESEHSVSRGLENSFAAILGGMSNKATNSASFDRIYELVRGAPVDHGGVDQANELNHASRRMTEMVFGDHEGRVTESIGRASGLSSGAAARVLATAAPVLLGYLGKLVRTEGLGRSAFADLLHRENTSIRASATSEMEHLWGPTETASIAAPRTDHGSTTKHRVPGWVVASIALACIVGFWLIQRGMHNAHTVAETAANAAAESATRARSAVEGLGAFVSRELPGKLKLHVPEHGMEVRFLAFVQDPSAGTDTWFDFDRLTFDTGSAELKPESREQLQNIASIMKAYPSLRIKIGGYTDNVGDPSANMTLSTERAESVKQELIRMGVGEDRVQTEGYGERYSIADNATEEGRAKNRRISIRIVQR